MTRYFAYASNMNPAQMKERLRWKAERLGAVCLLRNFRIAFNKLSKDGTGKANIEPADGEVVWGAVYDLSEAEMNRMADYERGYSPAVVEVECEGGGRTEARTYIADPPSVRSGLKVAPSYLRIILDGAEAHGLPRKYIDSLRRRAEVP